jgi:nucleoside-diphosphate-sugar epimerase
MLMTNHTSDIKDHTFLVTGSAGFIGYHVARTLLDQGARVVGLDNFNDYYSPALKHDRDQELRRRGAPGCGITPISIWCPRPWTRAP